MQSGTPRQRGRCWTWGFSSIHHAKGWWKPHGKQTPLTLPAVAAVPKRLCLSFPKMKQKENAPEPSPSAQGLVC